MFSLQGKVAVVTGGASGIGAAVVSRFRDAGALVVVGDIAEGGDLRSDVADENAVSTLIDAAVAAHGRLDVLVNNAGIALPATPFDEESTARMLRLFRVNTLGVLYGTKHASRVMTDGGSIVNVGSLASDVAWAGHAAYATSKAGVLALTRNAAVEFAARGIRVNAVQPAMVETPMTAHDLPELHAERDFVRRTAPQARTAIADEVAAAVHFLASDDCAHLTGQALVVDGGLTAGPSVTALGWSPAD